MTALDRLVDANPVPDETWLLDAAGAMDSFVLTVLERSGIVEPTQPSSDASTVTPISEETHDVGVRRGDSRRGPLVALGAAAVVLIVVAAGLVIRQSAPSIPVTGIDGDPDALEAFAAVEAAYEVYNSGDVETWLTEILKIDEESDPGWFAFHEARMAADARYQVEGCGYEGFGVWRDGVVLSSEEVRSGASITGHRFNCIAWWSNRLYDAADLTQRQHFTWLVSDGAVVAADIGFDQRSAIASFDEEFRDWMTTVHPEVKMEYNSPYSGFGEELGGVFTEESMPTALEYVDEFVDQSPNWPATP